MQTFTDIHGRKWTVAVTIGTIKRVKMRLGIDMIDPETFSKQGQDTLSLIDILYVVCQDEADQHGITDEQFACSLAGPSLREAIDAFWEAYLAFFPDPRAAAKLRVLIDKNRAVGEKMLALLEKKMPQITRKLDSEINHLLDVMEKEIDDQTSSGNASTNSPESSGSTHRRSRSSN